MLLKWSRGEAGNTNVSFGGHVISVIVPESSVYAGNGTCEVLAILLL